MIEKNRKKIMTNYSPNVSKLIMKLVSYNAVPKGGGLSSGLEFFTNPERRKEILEKAEFDALLAIELVKTASDNPYGNDDEAIAKSILDKIIERENKRFNK
jgi:hypothetical protein